MFRRGDHFFRRAYYIGPGGAIFFYDEPIPDGDPSLGAIAPDGLPTCPEDADDCQGFSDPAAGSVPIDPRAAAVQVLMSVRPDVSWQADGVIFTNDDTGEDNLVRYSHLEVTVNHYLPFGAGPEQLYVGTTGLFVEGYRFYSGSYLQNKPDWDRVIVALRTLGVRAATPSGSDRDIRSIR